jgi:hypothetical protein
MAKKPPNKICPKCGRKSLAPEGGPAWFFPKNKICQNCTSLKFGYFYEINANRRPLIKTVEQSQAVFPLSILDMTENELVGVFRDFKSLKRRLNGYRADYPRSRIKIIDKKYHDFTDYLISSTIR